MGGLLDGRFKRLIGVEAQDSTKYTSDDANEVVDIANAKVNVSAKPPAGLTYRVTMCGTIAGGNAKPKVHIKLGATQFSNECDAVTAGEYRFVGILVIVNPNKQKFIGHFDVDSLDAAVEYIDGTVDLTAGAVLQPQIEAEHNSDSITCEFCTVESWIKE